MKVREIMSTGIACIKPSASVEEAAKIMAIHNIGSVPVCGDNGLMGIVTDRDIVVRNIAKGMNPSSTCVNDVMTSGVAYVSPEMELKEVIDIMSQNQVRRVPVIEEKKVVGMISLGDIAKDYRFDIEAAEALSEISKIQKK